jgi:hypothetical protein
MSRDHLPYFSGRAVVRAGALASIGAALPGGLFATDSKLPAITKTIPATGEKLPVMGVGDSRRAKRRTHPRSVENTMAMSARWH